MVERGEGGTFGRPALSATRRESSVEGLGLRIECLELTVARCGCKFLSNRVIRFEFGVKCFMFGVRCLAFSFQCLVCGVECVVFNVQSPLFGVEV